MVEDTVLEAVLEEAKIQRRTSRMVAMLHTVAPVLDTKLKEVMAGMAANLETWEVEEEWEEVTWAVAWAWVATWEEEVAAWAETWEEAVAWEWGEIWEECKEWEWGETWEEAWAVWGWAWEAWEWAMAAAGVEDL